MLSVALIIPAGLRAKANALGEAMGWGPDNYSVALSASGQKPASYYGCHAWTGDDFPAMIEGAAANGLPAEVFPVEDLAEVLGALIVSVRSDMAGHFADVLTANGLRMVEPPLW